jgi:hypothetical protein
MLEVGLPASLAAPAPISSASGNATMAIDAIFRTPRKIVPRQAPTLLPAHLLVLGVVVPERIRKQPANY